MQTHSPEAPEHPFWATVRTFNEATGRGPLEYEPLPWNTEKRHDYVTQAVVDISINALCLLLAMEGDDSFDATKHREIFQFVSTTNFGVQIGFAAFHARKSIHYIPTFSESLKFPEFMNAVASARCAGVKDGRIKTDSGTIEYLAKMHEKLEADPVAFDWYFKQAQSEASDSISFAREIHSLIQRKKEAEDQAMRRAKAANRSGEVREARKSRFKDLLINNWIIAALWCRSSSDILDIIEPGWMKPARASERVDHAWKTVKALDADMSRLGLLPSRIFKYESRIKKSEADFWQRLDSVNSP